MYLGAPYGWFGGGFTDVMSDIVDRITIGDDTTNTIDRCDLTVGRSGLTAFADGVYGWFDGGCSVGDVGDG